MEKRGYGQKILNTTIDNNSYSIDVALNEIEKNRGILYDEQVVDACLTLFRKKGFKFE